VEAVREVFSSEDRYKGIERFMAVLGPYIKMSMPQGKGDYQGSAQGASSQDILQDLLDDMNEEDQQQFLSELTEQIENGEGDDFCDGIEDSVSSEYTSIDEINNLELSALHEFYKRNHPEVTIVGSDKQGESVVVGKKQRFRPKNTQVITEERLSRLNLQRIARFQQRTRLPVLIPLGDNLYRLNEYDVQESEVRDIIYVDTGLDVPEEVEFYLDSSGSMFRGHNNLGFNDNSRWDMLSSAMYGHLDALYQASIELKKPCFVQIHNLANKQVSSKRIPIAEFWESSPSDVLQVIFKPENGYDVEDLDIQVKNDGKRRAYVIVTDGQLVIDGRTARESSKMKQLAKQPNTDVILYEIGGEYGLGRAVRSSPGIHYLQVHNKEKMLSHGLEVLLAK